MIEFFIITKKVQELLLIYLTLIFILFWTT